MSLLRADGVRLERGGRVVLDDVSMAATPGVPLAVTGPSGSGKSSLLAVLAGLERPDAGRARLGDTPIGESVRDRLGLVLQGYGLVSVLTARENVELVLQSRGVPRGEVRMRSAAALASVALEDVADHLVEQLSGGQQQRVAVARALVPNPSVVLADEPTAELDAQTRERILTLLFSAAYRGAVLVIATHDRSVAERCPHEVRLADGRLVGERDDWGEETG